MFSASLALGTSVGGAVSVVTGGTEIGAALEMPIGAIGPTRPRWCGRGVAWRHHRVGLKQQHHAGSKEGNGRGEAKQAALIETIGLRAVP